MALKSSIVIILLLIATKIDAHGRLMEPVNRASAWRKNFSTPRNYDDNGVNCGGYFVSIFFSLLLDNSISR